MPNDFMNNTLEALQRLDALPDDAVVPSRITGMILGISERTIRYHPHLPRVQISRGRYGQRVGDVRKLAREGMPTGEAFTKENGALTK